MLERDSHKAKTSCIAWKRNKSGVEVTRLTQELSTGTKRKKGMLEYCFSSFPDKKRVVRFMKLLALAWKGWG